MDETSKEGTPATRQPSAPIPARVIRHLQPLNKSSVDKVVSSEEVLPVTTPASPLLNNPLSVSVVESKRSLTDSNESKNKLSGTRPYRRKFDGLKKRRFIRLARKIWPDIGSICEGVGISPATYYKEIKTDPIFAHLVAMVDTKKTDRVEAILAREAENPKSFLDRIAYLKARRPELYDRARRVIVQDHRIPQAIAGEFLDSAKRAVDAEIIGSGVNDRGITKELRAGAAAGGANE